MRRIRKRETCKIRAKSNQANKTKETNQTRKPKPKRTFFLHLFGIAESLGDGILGVLAPIGASVHHGTENAAPAGLAASGSERKTKTKTKTETKTEHETPGVRNKRVFRRPVILIFGASAKENAHGTSHEPARKNTTKKKIKLTRYRGRPRCSPSPSSSSSTRDNPRGGGDRSRRPPHRPAGGLERGR